MYRAAESGKRRGWLWGLITLLWIVSLETLYEGGLSTVFLGFVAAFVTMIIANFINDPSTR